MTPLIFNFQSIEVASFETLMFLPLAKEKVLGDFHAMTFLVLTSNFHFFFFLNIEDRLFHLISSETLGGVWNEVHSGSMCVKSL